MNEHMRTIEVGGLKFDVDMRTAKKVETYKVGDKVKVLWKSYSGYNASPGVIVGIDAFQKLPTIVIAYIENPLDGSGKLNFAYLNEKNTETEICPMSEDDVVPNRETILAFFQRAIDVTNRELENIRAKKEYFLRQYGTAFGVGAADVAAAVMPPVDTF